MINVMKRD